MLRQPVSDVLGMSNHVLLAGCGGGYDVMGAIPLLFELIAEGKKVSLFSYSFTALHRLENAEQMSECGALYSVPGAAASDGIYCPEAWIAKWMSQQLGDERSVWSVDRIARRDLPRASPAYRLDLEKQKRTQIPI